MSDTPESNAELVNQLQLAQKIVHGEIKHPRAGIVYHALTNALAALTTAPEPKPKPKKAQTEYMTCDKQFSAKPEPQGRVSISRECAADLHDFYLWEITELENMRNNFRENTDPWRKWQARLMVIRHNAQAVSIALDGQALQQQESGE